MQDFQVGDIIRAYHKGYWRVTEIVRRYLKQEDLRYTCYQDRKAGDELSPLIHYELVMDSNGGRPKGKLKTNRCDAVYCTKLTREWVEEQKGVDVAKWDKVLEIL